MHEGRKFVACLSSIKVANADDVGIAAVWKLWNFIIAIRLKRTSVFPAKDIPEAGNGFKKNWINALCFVLIAIVNFTLKVSSPQWKH